MHEDHSSFLALPGELQNAILEQLDYPSVVLLTSTCTHFRDLIGDSIDFVCNYLKETSPRELEPAPRYAGKKGLACLGQPWFCSARQRCQQAVVYSRKKWYSRLRDVLGRGSRVEMRVRSTAA